MDIKGLSKENIVKISQYKKEDDWVLDYRMKAFEAFTNMKEQLPFGPSFSLDLDTITYYKSQDEKMVDDWNQMLKPVRNELESLGVKEAEQHLGGMGIQYESEVIYHNMLEELEKKHVIFTSIEMALKKYPSIARKYFGKIVSFQENRYAALNSSVFSGGSFIYIPPHTKLDRPLQSYFRINSKSMGQFERTLIIVDDDSELHSIEGCTAPSYSDASLHAAVVEIYVGKGSKCRYTTIQNWATNVYNLVTKRALVEEDGIMEWIDGNIGSCVTMKYPSCILKGARSSGTCITISVATHDQQQDTGARMIHLGPHTTSKIISKSIARSGGNATYRGKVRIAPSASFAASMVKCDSLILDAKSKSDTIPTNICEVDNGVIEHEATVSKISDENLFYLMSKGISKEKAEELIILGFIDAFKEELPMEYAVELNQLLKRNL